MMTLTRQGANTVQHIPKCPGNAGCQNDMRELQWQPFIDALRAQVRIKNQPYVSLLLVSQSAALLQPASLPSHHRFYAYLACLLP